MALYDQMTFGISGAFGEQHRLPNGVVRNASLAI